MHGKTKQQTLEKALSGAHTSTTCLQLPQKKNVITQLQLPGSLPKVERLFHGPQTKKIKTKIKQEKLNNSEEPFISFVINILVWFQPESVVNLLSFVADGQERV